MSTSRLPDGYSLHQSPPSVPDYLELRQSTGLTPVNRAQAEVALANSWYGVYITHVPSSTTVAMGRIIGDGGWYFCIADMAVLPDHQRKGLGDHILTRLMDRIREKAPKGAPGAHVDLFADVPGRRLYERHGFRDTMPRSLGMGQWLEKS